MEALWALLSDVSPVLLINLEAPQNSSLLLLEMGEYGFNLRSSLFFFFKVVALPLILSFVKGGSFHMRFSRFLPTLKKQEGAGSLFKTVVGVLAYFGMRGRV